MADGRRTALARHTETSGLLGRLRAETADLHREVEAVVDVPGTLRTPADYAGFLGRLHLLHSGFEAELSAPCWQRGWSEVGLQITAHHRSGSLAADLDSLGAEVPTARLDTTGFASFGHALGGLYVLEGSALGGRTVIRIVTAAMGPVPATFLTGAGRIVAPWSALCHGLRRFAEQGGDGDSVVQGARSTFQTYARCLGSQSAGQ